MDEAEPKSKEIEKLKKPEYGKIYYDFCPEDISPARIDEIIIDKVNELVDVVNELWRQHEEKET